MHTSIMDAMIFGTCPVTAPVVTSFVRSHEPTLIKVDPQTPTLIILQKNEHPQNVRLSEDWSVSK